MRAVINIIRDGRAVVNSLLNVSFWKEENGFNRPWWADFPDNYYAKWLKTGKIPIALAALQWKHIIKLTELESSNLSSDEHINIKYEDFTANTADCIKSILDFCQLDNHKYITAQLKNLKVQSMNFKWKENLSLEDINLLEELIGDVLKDNGYPLSLTNPI